MNKALLSLVAISLCAALAAQSNEVIKHRFLLIDEGVFNLLLVDESDPSKNWSVPLQQMSPRDMQLVGANRLLVGGADGYTEYDISTGAVLKEVKGFEGITSVRRLENGGTMIFGVDAAKKEIFMTELDAQDQLVKTFPITGNYVRLVRQTGKGNFLLACDKEIVEISPKGKEVGRYPVEGFNHCWKAVKLHNGTILASGGYGPFIAELDKKGKLTRTYGSKDELDEAVRVHFYATFQLLSNGDVVVANWQGHGAGHGELGRQLIQLDPTGKLVWSWSDASMISSLQGVLILDGLDANLLHDEREGVMVPVGKK